MCKLLSIAVLALLTIPSFASQSPRRPGLDLEVITEASGSQAKVESDGVVRIAWPRNDVPVKVEGVPLPPAAGLGTWAAFKQDHGKALVMGDTVVFQDEVDAAMDAAFANGLDVTALHNHFFYEEPRVFFMHIHGHGEPRQLATAVKAVWDAVKKVRAGKATPDDHFSGEGATTGSIDPQVIEKIIGLKANALSDTLVKVSVGRDARMHGMRVSESMGVNTWAAFSGSAQAASVDGDFAMTASEITPVLKALRAKGVHIVALHNHMSGDVPGYFFTHFWGKGTVNDLATAFKSALDEQKGASPLHKH